MPLSQIFKLLLDDSVRSDVVMIHTASSRSYVVFRYIGIKLGKDCAH